MRIKPLLDRFHGRKILVIGDVFVDEYLNGDCSRLSPEAPVPILRVTSSFQVLGGAANTAANVASLGGSPVLIGLVGEDEAGRAFRAAASEAGIALRPITDGRPTTRKTRLVGQRQQLIRLDFEETRYVDAAAEAALLAAAAAEMDSAEAVVISDYAKGCLTENLCRQLIEMAHLAGKRVIIDPRPQHGAFYRGGDFLTPNWKEALGLAGMPEKPADPDAIAAVGAAIRNRLGAEVLLTLGPQGMAFQGEESFSLPTVAREVFDVSGAGDTVVAAFALALASGCARREAAFLANLAAGIVVGKFGTATVTREEMLKAGEEPSRLLRTEEVLALARRWKAKGRRIGLVLGDFPVLEPAAIGRIEEVRKGVEIIVAGIPDEPGAKDRAGMLLALRSVDYVCVLEKGKEAAFAIGISPDRIAEFPMATEAQMPAAATA